MLTKIVILLSATAVLTFNNVRLTPEELREFIQDIGQTINANEHEAQISIRSYLVPLDFLCAEADTYIFGNLTLLATPYWEEIASIEKEAAGQNISACIELGNKQLYALNATTVAPLVQEVGSYFALGNQTISDSFAAISGLLEELRVLEEKADQCSENECADELKNEGIDLFTKASDTINGAVSAAHDCVLVDLPVYLANVTIDAVSYITNYRSYLKDVRSCVNDL